MGNSIGSCAHNICGADRPRPSVIRDRRANHPTQTSPCAVLQPSRSGSVVPPPVSLAQTQPRDWRCVFCSALFLWAMVWCVTAYTGAHPFSWWLTATVVSILAVWWSGSSEQQADVIDDSSTVSDPISEARDLAMFLAELRSRFEDEQESDGWQDNSRPNAKLFTKFPTNPDRLLVSMLLRVRDQAPSLPLVKTSGTTILGGLIPIFCAPAMWPVWLPFCTGSTLLRRISVGQEIWHLSFRVAFVTADCVIYMGLSDGLKNDGCVEVTIGSPDQHWKNSRWLGAAVPKQTAQLRVPIRLCKLILKPTDTADALVTIHADMLDLLKIKWIHILFWGTLSTLVLPKIAKVHATFSGSALDRYYNGGGYVEEAEFFSGIAQQIAAHVAVQ